MAYLFNTFFSTENMPEGLPRVISLLPLSQTSGMMRRIAAGESWSWSGIVVLLVYLVVFAGASSWFLYKKKNL